MVDNGNSSIKLGQVGEVYHQWRNNNRLEKRKDQWVIDCQLLKELPKNTNKN